MSETTLTALALMLIIGLAAWAARRVFESWSLRKPQKPSLAQLEEEIHDSREQVLLGIIELKAENKRLRELVANQPLYAAQQAERVGKLEGENKKLRARLRVKVIQSLVNMMTGKIYFLCRECNGTWGGPQEKHKEGCLAQLPEPDTIDPAGTDSVTNCYVHKDGSPRGVECVEGKNETPN